MTSDVEHVTISARGEQVVASKKVIMSIPYFESLLSGRWECDRELSIDADPTVFKAFIAYACDNHKNMSLLLTKLPRGNLVQDIIDLSDFLCRSLPLVDNLEELNELEKRLKNIKKHFISPKRNEARNAAAQLAFSLIRGSIDLSNNRLRSKVFNNVLFVVSRAKIFGPRLRTHLWRVYDELVNLTPKQEKQFEEWVSDRGLSFEFNKRDDDDGSMTDGDCSTGSVNDLSCDEYDEYVFYLSTL